MLFLTEKTTSLDIVRCCLSKYNQYVNSYLRYFMTNYAYPRLFKRILEIGFGSHYSIRLSYGRRGLIIADIAGLLPKQHMHPNARQIMHMQNAIECHRAIANAVEAVLNLA